MVDCELLGEVGEGDIVVGSGTGVEGELAGYGDIVGGGGI